MAECGSIWPANFAKLGSRWIWGNNAVVSHHACQTDPRGQDWRDAGTVTRLCWAWAPRVRSYLTRATLAEMQQRLARDGFVRIHRSRLVNLERVRELRPSSRGASTVVLKSGTHLEASYGLLKEIQERWGT